MKILNTNDHIEVIVNCAAKFPEMRFGQFLIGVVMFNKDMPDSSTSGQNLFYEPDRRLADKCKAYCKHMQR